MNGATQFKCLTLALALSGLAVLSGCQSGNTAPNAARIGDPLASAYQNELQRTTEVEMVEEMARYRNAYRKQLELMGDFYDRQGNHMKNEWVRQELAALNLIPRYSYLVVAEIAGGDLRAVRAIVEADAMYEEGLALFNEGRGALNILSNRSKLLLARDRFNELITRYPDSDKIDDAAFQIAEINHHFLDDYRSALIYYQRTWQWDPQTPWPARYQVARIYDRLFHDRIKAIEYYELAIKLEPAYSQNAANAATRIKDLTNTQK